MYNMSNQRDYESIIRRIAVTGIVVSLLTIAYSLLSINL